MYNYGAITEIFIDPQNGCDWFSGTSPDDKNGYGPVKSIAVALERIKYMRKLGEKQPVTIRLMQGVHYVDKTIVLDAEHSNISFENYTGEALLLGAKKIEKISADSFNGTSCISFDLPEGTMPTDLFVNNSRAEHTRYPEDGFLETESTGSQTISQFDSSDWFVATEDLSRFDGLFDATIKFNHFWIRETLKIKAFDSTTRRAEFTEPTLYSIYVNNTGNQTGTGEANAEDNESTNDSYTRMEYFIEDLPQMFKKPNQFYYDKASNKVYYIPLANTMPEIYIPAVTKMFDIKADNVSFRGLVFKYTSCFKEGVADMQSSSSAEALINFTEAANGIVTGCRFENFGLYGIAINQLCRNMLISKNVFENCGAGGIKVFSDRAPVPEAVPQGITICDNLIRNCGIIHPDCCGILVMNARECKIIHNEICYTSYSGISVGWQWDYEDNITNNNLIEKNHIHHIAQKQLSDLGGIYVLGRQTGSAIRGNLIHDVTCRNYGGCGIYLDQAASYFVVENNIVYDVETAAIQQNFGHMNVIRNNILFGGTLGCFATWKNHYSVASVLNRNIMIAGKGMQIYGGIRIQALTKCIASDKNLFFDFYRETPVMYNHLLKEKTLDDMHKEHPALDCNSIVADPMFKDCAMHNLELESASPGFDIGFVTIDMSDVGIR